MWSVVKQRLPNTFIIGAQKCGTTALSSYLAQHPAVFMSQPKEPRHFCSDLAAPAERRAAGDLVERSAYLALFQDASPAHRILCEASSAYVMSHEAVERILDFNPAARFILLLRNPVELVRSLHAENLLQGRENERDLKRAWGLQEQRRLTPPQVLYAEFLQYARVASLGSQLERVSRLIPEGQLKTLLYDDFSDDTRASYLEVLAFLGLPDDGLRQFPVLNSARTVCHPRLLWALRRLQRGWMYWKVRLGIRHSPGVLRRLISATLVSGQGMQRDEAFRVFLTDYFRAEIELLEARLGRDLGHWRRPVVPPDSV